MAWAVSLMIAACGVFTIHATDRYSAGIAVMLALFVFWIVVVEKPKPE